MYKLGNNFLIRNLEITYEEDQEDQINLIAETAGKILPGVVFVASLEDNLNFNTKASRRGQLAISYKILLQKKMKNIRNFLFNFYFSYTQNRVLRHMLRGFSFILFIVMFNMFLPTVLADEICDAVAEGHTEQTFWDRWKYPIRLISGAIAAGVIAKGIRDGYLQNLRIGFDVSLGDGFRIDFFIGFSEGTNGPLISPHDPREVPINIKMPNSPNVVDVSSTQQPDASSAILSKLRIRLILSLLWEKIPITQFDLTVTGRKY